jgi:hypothetical protein
MSMKLQIVRCPDCGAPRFFTADAKVPVEVKCTNLGFRWTEGVPVEVPPCICSELAFAVVFPLPGEAMEFFDGVKNVVRQVEMKDSPVKVFPVVDVDRSAVPSAYRQ